MKKCILGIALGVVLLANCALAGTLTPHYSLYFPQPDDPSSVWGTQIPQNFLAIDQYLWGLQLQANTIAPVINVEASPYNGNIQAAVTAAAGQAWVWLKPYKTYTITSELILWTGTEGPKIMGNFATIQAGASMTNVISVSNTSSTVRVQIRDLIVDANGKATNAIYLKLVNEQNSMISNVTAENALTNNWKLEKCQVALFMNLRSAGAGSDGYDINDCNGSTFITPRSVGDGGNGMTVRKTDYTGGVNIINPDIETCTGHGIQVTNTLSQVRIYGGWFETIGKHGILSSTVGVSIRDNRISGGDAGNVYRAIYLDTGAAGNIVEHNGLAYSLGTQYDRVYDNSGVLTNTIRDNFHNATGELVIVENSQRFEPLKIRGTKSMANSPVGLFSVVLGTGQSVSIQLWVGGVATGLSTFSYSNTISAIQNGGAGAMAAASGTAVLSDNSSGATLTLDTGTANTLTVKFNHGSVSAGNVDWEAVIIGDYSTVTEL